jgi:hypothetical protein
VNVDRRTGKVYEGINGNNVISDSQLHPTLKDSLQTIPKPKKIKDETTGTHPLDSPNTPRHAYPDAPLRHAEVKATNQNLHDRAADDLPVDKNSLKEILSSPQFIDTAKVPSGAAPMCMNCNKILTGVTDMHGRFETAARNSLTDHQHTMYE